MSYKKTQKYYAFVMPELWIYDMKSTIAGSHTHTRRHRTRRSHE